MHIGNRIFPYPVLNRSEDLSDYVPDSMFSLAFDVGENKTPIIKNGEVIFQNLHYNLTDKSLKELVERGAVKGAFIVECSASVYRNMFEISSDPYDLRVSAHDINGHVVASCYLYATEDIADFKSSGFISEYSEYSFDIDKFDILAVDDGVKFKIEMDPKEDDKVASIFTVIKKETDGKIMTYTNDGKKIILYLPTAYYSNYETIKTKKDFNNISFAVLAIPALAVVLKEIQNTEYSSIEEIQESNSWFNAICLSYKRKNGTELSFEDFSNMDSLELAQEVLNSAPCNALKDFDKLIVGGTGNADEDGEEV